MRRIFTVGNSIKRSTIGGDIEAYSSNFDQGSGIPTIEPGKVRITPLYWVDNTDHNTYFNWFAIRRRNLAGSTPHFVINKQYFFTGLSTGMQFGFWSTSSDTDIWYAFDNITIGASDVELYNNIPFPSGTIYISMGPMYPVSRTDRKVAEWSNNSYVGDTTSSTNKIIGYTTSRLSDNNSRIVPALPLYAFQILKTSVNTRNNILFSAGMHAGEVNGRFVFEGAIDWLLAGSFQAETFLCWSKILCYPIINPQGIWAGHARNPVQDPGLEQNRYWDVPGHDEQVDILNSAMATDSGGVLEAGVDCHSYLSTSTTEMGDVEDVTAPGWVAFKNQYKVYDSTISQLQEYLPNCLPYRCQHVWGAKVALTLEQGVAKTRTIAMLKTSGVNTMKSLADLTMQGYFTNGPTVGSRTFNGTTDHIYWASPWTPASGQPITISAWVKLTSNVTLDGIWIADMASTPGSGLYLWMPSSATHPGIIQINAKGATDCLYGSDDNVMTTGTWIHILATWTGLHSDYTSMHIYKNGTELSHYNHYQNGVSPVAYDGIWSVGGWHSSDNYNTHGNIAQVAVWNQVLSSPDIGSLAMGTPASSISPATLKFYFAGKTSGLTASPGGNGTLDGTTEVVGYPNGPGIYYP